MGHRAAQRHAKHTGREAEGSYAVVPSLVKERACCSGAVVRGGGGARFTRSHPVCRHSAMHPRSFAPQRPNPHPIPGTHTHGCKKRDEPLMEAPCNIQLLPEHATSLPFSLWPAFHPPVALAVQCIAPSGSLQPLLCRREPATASPCPRLGAPSEAERT